MFHQLSSFLQIVIKPLLLCFLLSWPTASIAIIIADKADIEDLKKEIAKYGYQLSPDSLNLQETIASVHSSLNSGAVLTDTTEIVSELQTSFEEEKKGASLGELTYRDLCSTAELDLLNNEQDMQKIWMVVKYFRDQRIHGRSLIFYYLTRSGSLVVFTAMQVFRLFIIEGHLQKNDSIKWLMNFQPTTLFFNQSSQSFHLLILEAPSQNAQPSGHSNILQNTPYQAAQNFVGPQPSLLIMILVAFLAAVYWYSASF